MSPEAVDPASVSALGGTLRAHALRLVDLLDGLGEPSPGSRRTPVAETARERELLAAAATELDRVGAALQALVMSAVERSVRRRGLEDEAARHELGIEDSRVAQRPGPSRVDPESRRRAHDNVQELLNRVTAAQGRDLAMVVRELEGSLATLRAISVRAREGTG